MSNPEVSNIRRTNGVAGQFQYSAQVRYSGENEPRTVIFVGTTYGAAVVMVTRDMPGGQHVVDPGRFGPELNPQWVRNFFA